MIYGFLQALLLFAIFLKPSFFVISCSGFIFLVSTLINNRYGNGLTQFNGPFWASLTNFWRVRNSYINGNKRPTVVALHTAYGDVVRVGPKALVFASPNAIADIYPPSKGMAKSPWYIAFEAHGKGPKKENVFSTRDIHWHARYRNLVEPGFKLDHLGAKESQIDDLIRNLLRNLDDAAFQTQGGAGVNLPLNLQYFTFDAGGAFAFSQPYGFLEKRVDLDGIIQSVHSGAVHLNRLAQAPIIQMFFDKNPLAIFFGFIAPPMAFAKKYLPVQRINAHKEDPEKNIVHHDILDKYLEANKSSPGIVSTDEIVDLGLMVVVPASEAVRTAMATFIYHITNHRQVLAKLQNEIRAHLPNLSTAELPSYAVTSKMPYLDACVKEVLRIHPPTGFARERIVPPSGAMIDGHFVPGGTAVSVSDWMVHRNVDIYGQDVEAFRPERWIEATREKREAMEKFLCPFGFEQRLCLGRDVALFEIYKMGATMFGLYDFELEKPDEDMKITWGNIVSVDFNVRMKRRKA